jgi:hypothetical protein
MDWLTFVAEVVRATAWPLSVVVSILLVRRLIGRLLPTLRTAKYKGLELEFGKKLEALESAAEKASLPQPVERPTNHQTIGRLATISSASRRSRRMQLLQKRGGTLSSPSGTPQPRGERPYRETS